MFSSWHFDIVGLTTEQIHSVEMFGDATRTPVILDVTKQLFNKTELFRTLNSLEAVARGAALQSAFLSPAFSAAKFNVEELNQIPIKVFYGDNGSEEMKEATIFGDKVKSLPWSQQMSFPNKLGNMTLQLKYADSTNVLKGLPDLIAQYTIGEAKRKHADKKDSKCELQFVFENTGSHVPKLKECNLIEKWIEEEKIPIKKPAPAQPKPEEKKDEQAPAEGEAPKAEAPAQPETVQEFETKLKNKQSTVSVMFNMSFHGMLNEALDAFRQIEGKLNKSDRAFLDLKESKNRLETICYKYRDGLQGKLAEYMEDQARDAVIKEITTTVDWLYGEGESSTIEEYDKRYKKLFEACDPCKKRSIFHEEVSYYFQ